MTLVLIFFRYVSSIKRNKGKIKKWGYIKLKSFHTARKLSTKEEPTEWEEILANNTFNKELLSKPHIELIQLNIQKKKKI